MLLRSARPEDTPGICALLGDVYQANPKADPHRYATQYWDNPFGPPASWVWEDQGRIVCHGGLFRVPGVLDGDPVPLGHSADSATAPSHRGRGLFAQLAAARYAGAHEAGMALVMTFPNPLSLPGTTGAGLHVVGRVAAHVLPLDDAWVASVTHLGRTSGALRAVTFRVRAGGSTGAPILGVPDDVDLLWQRCTPAHVAGLRRDAAWWRWRYADPVYRFVEVRTAGRLDGLAALRLRDAMGGRLRTVMDLLAVDGPAARALLATPSEDQAQGVVALALPGTPAAAQLRAAGLRRVPRRLEPRPMVLGLADGTRPATPLLSAPWTVSWGDHDHL